jgi:hypothetical protein
MAVRLDEGGGVSILGVTPKPMRWRAPLVPFEPALHSTAGWDAAPAARGPGALSMRVGAADPRAGATIPGRRSAGRETLAVLVDRCRGVTACSGDPMVHHLHLSGARADGDVLGVRRTGGAVWRVPHIGDGTRYRIVRLGEPPRVVAHWRWP